LEKPSEIELLERVCKEAKKEGKLDGSHLNQLYETFGTRFTKAWEALKEGRVKKYTFKPSNRVVWIVIGKERDYLVIAAADFCMCDDFYFRVLDQQIHLCYHLIAQKIAEVLGWYDKIEEHDDLHDTLMAEWKKVTP
jgi:predicted nucleic acid-binding Zn finger protein